MLLAMRRASSIVSTLGNVSIGFFLTPVLSEEHQPRICSQCATFERAPGGWPWLGMARKMRRLLPYYCSCKCLTSGKLKLGLRSLLSHPETNMVAEDLSGILGFVQQLGFCLQDHYGAARAIAAKVTSIAPAQVS